MQVTGNYENQLKGGEFYGGKNTLAFDLGEEEEGNREEYSHPAHNNHKSPSKDIFNNSNNSNNKNNKNHNLEPFFSSLSIDSNPDISTIQPLYNNNNNNTNGFDKLSQANVSALRDLLEKEIGTFHFSKVHKTASALMDLS